MKTILAFGDSLTWGSCPFTAGRHPREDRWPNAMAAGLADVEVITEALPGRTTAYYRPGVAEYRGDLYLPTLLHSHAPLDLVMIMLGTNDIYSNVPMHQIWWGLRRLVEIVRHHPFGHADHKTPQILLIAPPTFSGGKFLGVDDAMAAESRKIGAMVADLAAELDVAYFDAAGVAHAEAGDGLHLEAHVSRALGGALQAPVAALLGLTQR